MLIEIRELLNQVEWREDYMNNNVCIQKQLEEKITIYLEPSKDDYVSQNFDFQVMSDYLDDIYQIE